VLFSGEWRRFPDAASSLCATAMHHPHVKRRADDDAGMRPPARSPGRCDARSSAGARRAPRRRRCVTLRPRCARPDAAAHRRMYTGL
jgi:hypothetical protein